MSDDYGFPIVHIGLAKTATSSLQQNVFPHIPKLSPTVVYNDRWCINQLKKNKNMMTTEEEKLFQNTIHSGKHFISLESLVDINPRNWVIESDRNLRLFGHDATIIITLRETEDYLRGVYQQMVHQGNIWCATEFFVNSSEYDKLSPILRPSVLSRFDVDSFDLEYLCKIYKERFSRVLIVPLSTIKELGFLKSLFNYDKKTIQFLRAQLNEGKHYNRSYSKRAMSLTMKRERLLNYFQLMSLGSANIEPKIRKDQILFKSSEIRLSNLKLVDKVRRLTSRVIKKLLNEFMWRHFLQNRFDKIVPYKKFELPKNIYRNEELASRNDDFIKRHEMTAAKF